ncbi:MAG: DUF2934 domain-containing protein [Terriglobales bacterium]
MATSRTKRVSTISHEAPAKPATSVPTEKKNGHANLNLEAAIRARAYELYEKRGRQDGFSQDDWLQAETEILSQQRQRTA